MNAVAVSVLIFLFLVVTVLGFAAVRWRKADLNSLDEWGLGGRGFGSFIAWFLIGGDLYTAYTFVAVPATADHRVRRARGLHLLLGPARAGCHRVRQGHPDPRRDHRRRDLPAPQDRRVGPRVQHRAVLLRLLLQGQRRRDRQQGGVGQVVHHA